MGLDILDQLQQGGSRTAQASYLAQVARNQQEMQQRLAGLQEQQAQRIEQDGAAREDRQRLVEAVEGADRGEPLPRILVEETHRGVEGGAAPHFQREKLRCAVREGVGRGEHVVAAHARGHEGLMRVTERGVGHQQDHRGLPRCGEAGAQLRQARVHQMGT